MAWQRSVDLSKCPDNTARMLKRSGETFNAVAETDSYALFEENGQSNKKIVSSALRAAGLEVDHDLATYIELGLREIGTVTSSAFVRAKLNGLSVGERVNIVKHPASIATYGLLAGRAEEMMDIAIGDYPGGMPAFGLSSDLTHIETSLAASTSKRSCPFANRSPEILPAPVFIKFCQWAAPIAVLQDNPSYIKRNS